MAIAARPLCTIARRVAIKARRVLRPIAKIAIALESGAFT
jgi:hypothetical protein